MGQQKGGGYKKACKADDSYASKDDKVGQKGGDDKIGFKRQ